MAVKYIAVLTIKLHAPWVHSLKEKRNQIMEMLRRSREQEELALNYIQKALAAPG